jgi:glycopeptide antibiotics resistance protein
MREFPRAQRAAAIVLAAYIVVVLLIVTWPTPVDSDSRSTIVSILRALHSRDLFTFVSYDHVEYTANIAMFVPLGILLAMWLGRRWWWVAMISCFALSGAIETFQGLALPSRYATFDDVIANTTGGVIGALVGALILQSLRIRTLEGRRRIRAAATSPSPSPVPTRMPEQTGRDRL